MLFSKKYLPFLCFIFPFISACNANKNIPGDNYPSTSCIITGEVVKMINNTCNIEDDGYESYEYYLKAIQEVDIAAQCDTIVLSIDRPIPLPIDGVGIIVNSVLSENKDSLIYYLGPNSLRVITKGNKHFTINYDVRFPNILVNCINIENSCISECFQQNQSSWFFTYPGITINSIKIISPSNTFFVQSFDPKYPDRNCIVIMDKRYFKKIGIHAYGRRINCFIHNFENDTIQIDTTLRSKNIADLVDVPVGTRKNIELNILTNIVQCTIHNISSIFRNKPKAALNIVERFWKNDNVYLGNTVSDNLIIIDGNLILGTSLIHEIIHSYDVVNYDTMCEFSSKYFFAESMIEYLALYISSLCGIKTAQGDCEYSENSIIGIERDDESTMDLIYTETPLKIYNFAKDIGQDQFIKFYSDYYRYSKRSGFFSIDSFRQSMIDYGFNPTIVNQFIDSL